MRVEPTTLAGALELLRYIRTNLKLVSAAIDTDDPA
jgi:hypothetical protein